MTRTSRRGRALRPVRSRGRIGHIFLAVFLGLLVVGVALAGVRVAQVLWRAKQTLDDIVDTPVPELTPGVTPQPTAKILEEPFSVLLLGIDRREGGGSTLNDVNIVVYVNPLRRFASMLSIPRDTLVDIPGHGRDKINAAYSLGELFHADTGGGPMLVRRTVEQFLDMPIDYHAVVDFRGFERIIDLVGGITVDVPAPLVDNEYPTEDYGYTRIYIPAGLQHMDGRTALQYARSRHADNDIARNRRQQQVLMALRERILRLEMLTDLERLQGLLDQLGASLRTDIQVNQVDTLWALVQLARRIERDKITSYTVDYRYLTEVPPSYLDPCVPCVRELAQEMQLDPTLRQLWAENASLEIRNGTLTCQGCAGRTAEYLRERGFVVVDVLNDEHAGAYTNTLILGSADFPFTCGELGRLLNVGSQHLCRVPSDSPVADIVIILGDDYRLPEQ